MLYDIEDKFNDIPDTDMEGLGNLNNLKDPFYPGINSFQNQEFRNPFNTDGFDWEDPSEIQEDFEELNRIIKLEDDSMNNNEIPTVEELIQTVMVPVFNVKTEEEKRLSYKSDSEFSETSSTTSVSSNTDNEEEPVEEEEDEDPKFWVIPPPKKKVRHPSSESEDVDWEPEEKPPKRKTQGSSRRKPSMVSKSVAHKPVPQQRKTGTKKITQWILSLLRDPQYNPSVITWEKEHEGVFFITDTTKFAKLWGKRKNNPSMDYGKLSRAMRYYYKNGELIAVEKRTTYRFGKMSDYWRSRSTNTT
jgi:hypothetical protein